MRRLSTSTSFGFLCGGRSSQGHTARERDTEHTGVHRRHTYLSHTQNARSLTSQTPSRSARRDTRADRKAVSAQSQTERARVVYQSRVYSVLRRVSRCDRSAVTLARCAVTRARTATRPSAGLAGGSLCWPHSGGRLGRSPTSSRRRGPPLAHRIPAARTSVCARLSARGCGRGTLREGSATRSSRKAVKSGEPQAPRSCASPVLRKADVAASACAVHIPISPQ